MLCEEEDDEDGVQRGGSRSQTIRFPSSSREMRSIVVDEGRWHTSRGIRRVRRRWIESEGQSRFETLSAWGCLHAPRQSLARASGSERTVIPYWSDMDAIVSVLTSCTRADTSAPISPHASLGLTSCTTTSLLSSTPSLPLSSSRLLLAFPSSRSSRSAPRVPRARLLRLGLVPSMSTAPTCALMASLTAELFLDRIPRVIPPAVLPRVD